MWTHSNEWNNYINAIPNNKIVASLCWILFITHRFCWINEVCDWTNGILVGTWEFSEFRFTKQKWPWKIRQNILEAFESKLRYVANIFWIRRNDLKIKFTQLDNGHEIMWFFPAWNLHLWITFFVSLFGTMSCEICSACWKWSVYTFF